MARLLAAEPALADELRAAHQAAAAMPKGRNFQ
jgi:hypothetical protein